MPRATAPFFFAWSPGRDRSLGRGGQGGLKASERRTGQSGKPALEPGQEPENPHPGPPMTPNTRMQAGLARGPSSPGWPGCVCSAAGRFPGSFGTPAGKPSSSGYDIRSLREPRSRDGRRGHWLFIDWATKTRHLRRADFDIHPRGKNGFSAFCDLLKPIPISVKARWRSLNVDSEPTGLISRMAPKRRPRLAQGG